MEPNNYDALKGGIATFLELCDGHIECEVCPLFQPLWKTPNPVMGNLCICQLFDLVNRRLEEINGA